MGAPTRLGEIPSLRYSFSTTDFLVSKGKFNSRYVLINLNYSKNNTQYLSQCKSNCSVNILKAKLKISLACLGIRLELQLLLPMVKYCIVVLRVEGCCRDISAVVMYFHCASSKCWVYFLLQICYWEGCHGPFSLLLE